MLKMQIMQMSRGQNIRACHWTENRNSPARRNHISCCPIVGGVVPSPVPHYHHSHKLGHIETGTYSKSCSIAEDASSKTTLCSSSFGADKIVCWLVSLFRYVITGYAGVGLWRNDPSRGATQLISINFESLRNRALPNCIFQIQPRLNGNCTCPTRTTNWDISSRPARKVMTRAMWSGFNSFFPSGVSGVNWRRGVLN